MSLHAAGYFHSMIQSLILKEPVKGNNTAALGIICAKYDSLHPGLHDCPRAHYAWFQCHVQCSINEAVIVELPRRLANGKDLCMSGRIIQRNTSVA